MYKPKPFTLEIYPYQSDNPKYVDVIPSEKSDYIWKYRDYRRNEHHFKSKDEVVNHFEEKYGEKTVRKIPN